MIKLIIWDLDGVLWQGSLSEEGITSINEQVVNFIKVSESKGTIHSICSKNNYDDAKLQLEQLGLYDLFVFPSIEYKSKVQRLETIINSCQLRPDDVLFVDDNIINTNEAKYYLPTLQISNNTDFINSFEYIGNKSKTEQYKILERKNIDKSNIDFLKDSDINLVITKEDGCILFHDRIVELVNKSNQLNFTKSRMEINFSDSNQSPYIHFNYPRENHAVFVWDKYGYYGLVGYFSSWYPTNITDHFVFSCRILNMGIENYCSKYIKEHYGWEQNYEIDTSGDYSYIKVHKYKDVKDFIEHQENLKPRVSQKEGIIVAGCLSYIFWALSNTYDKFDYDNSGLNLEKMSNSTLFKSLPNKIVYSLVFDFEISNFSSPTLAHMEHCLARFLYLCTKCNKKVLFILPENLYEVNKIKPIDNKILQFYKLVLSYISHPNVTPLFVNSHYADIRHWNRKQLYSIAQNIESWANNSLQLPAKVLN